MSIDPQRLRAYAPLFVFVAVVFAGWIALVRPAASAGADAAGRLGMLEARMAQVRASLDGPPPPPMTGDPQATFERIVASGDASSRIVQQLAALARAVSAENLLIETGDRMDVAPPGAPQASGPRVMADPRFALFDTPLTYTPIAMSFDAGFAAAGEFFWQLRDLATTVEVRTLALTPAPGVPGRVHVSLMLLAYARPQAPVITTGARP